MKVILFENVEKLGKQGDIVTVKDGYARNYLIPQNLAKTATDKTVTLLEEHKKKLRKKDVKLAEEARSVAEQVEKVQVVLSKKVGPEGKLYGSVTPSEVAEQLNEKGFNIDKKAVKIDEPIKTTGEFTVKVRLHKEVDADIKVVVQPDEEAEEK